MNQKNTIKSMIPLRLMEIVPSAERDKWADRIVEKFMESNPELYSALGRWFFVPEEDREELLRRVLAAADAIRKEMRDESDSAQ